MIKEQLKSIKMPLILKIGEIVSKTALFFMLPLYTFYFSPEEYGTVDIMLVPALFVAAFFSLNISKSAELTRKDGYDGMRRTIGFIYLMVTAAASIAALGILFLLKFLGVLPFDAIYFAFAVVCILSFPMCKCFADFLIWYGKDSFVYVSNIACNLVIILLSVIEIYVFHNGAESLLAAFCVGNVLRVTVLLIYGEIKIERERKLPDKALVKKLLCGCLPFVIGEEYILAVMLPVQISLFACGSVFLLGIFAAAGSISVILLWLQRTFGKRLPAVYSEISDLYDAKGAFEKAFSIFGTLSAVAAAIIIMFNRILAQILFSGSFYTSWHYSPVITAAVMFLGFILFQNEIFNACGKVKISNYTLLSGLALNILLSFVLVPKYGLFGAAYTLLSSLAVTFAVRCILLNIFIKMKINWVQQSASLVLVISQAIVSTTSGYGLVPYFFPIAILLINLSALNGLLNTNRH